MARTERYNNRMDSLNKRLRVQAKNIRIDNFFSFLYTADMVFNYIDNELRQTGLNRTQMAILSMLVLNGGTMTPTELSSKILRSKHATTKAVDSLEKLGLTKSEKTNLNSKVRGDRRLRKVSITEKGLELLETSMPARHRFGSSLMCCLDRQEANTFKTTLSRLRKHIADLENSASPSKSSIRTASH